MHNYYKKNVFLLIAVNSMLFGKRFKILRDIFCDVTKVSAALLFDQLKESYLIKLIREGNWTYQETENNHK